VGSKENIARARIFRKALGGGMRQAGIIAAAGLIALEEMPARLHEDHDNAKLLAEAVAACENVALDAAAVQTNIVIFELKDGGNAAEFVAALREEGIWCSAIGPHAVRLVTHFDVGREDCEYAAEAMVKLLQGMTVAG
jgi:threonine aldolase